MVFASKLFPDEDKERAFREKLQGLMREGKADLALAAVEATFAELGDHALSRQALSVKPDDVRITGWDKIAKTADSLDAHGPAITAVSIDFSLPSLEEDPDADKCLAPVLKTLYYCDEAYSFSASDRATLNTGYNRAGARWYGQDEHMDHETRVTGLEPVYGVYHAMFPHMTRGELTDLADYDIPRLAAMRAAILLHLAIARTVEEEGLPRAMTVLCGSEEDYPYFDAPIITRDEYEEATDAQAEAGDTDEALFTSLATLAPVKPVSTYQFQAETEHVSGRSLRHKLVRELQENANDEGARVEAEEPRSTSLFGRLFRRSA